MKIMSWQRTILTGGVTVFLMMLLAQPHEAAAATPPLLVQETEAQLVAAGCERVELRNNKAMVAAESLDWQAVVPTDATGEALLFCPPQLNKGYGPEGDGRVAGLITPAYALPGGPISGVGIAKWLYNNAGKIASNSARYASSPLLSTINDVLYWLLLLLFIILTLVAQWLIAILVNILVPLITLSSFVNNEVVRKAWPVVLSVANMGFLLALVLIALLTALRLEVGGGVKRLLPRLLIAALLVNFSLVIGGVILDASRIIMALIPPVFNLRLTMLPTKLEVKADLANITKSVQDMVSEFATGGSSLIGYLSPISGWSEVLAVVLSAVITWIIALSLAVVIFGLLIRYIMLILLLIVSPLAYLFIALPGASGLAKKWWTTFMRYVIYGPVVLFILMAAVGADRLIDASGFFNVNDTKQAGYQAILKAIVFSAALVAAAMAGRYAGILGAAAAISVATGAGRRVRGMAYGGTKGIAKGVAAPVTVPARFAAREGRKYLGKQAQGFLGAAGARIMAGFGYGKGAPPPGKKLGEAVFGKPLTREQRAQAAAAKSFKPTGAKQAQMDDSVQRSDAWRPSLLRQEHVGGALSKEQRVFIMKDMENTPENRAYKVALAGNAEAVRKMEADERSRIESLDVNLEVDLPTTGVDADTAKKNKKKNKENAIENEINRAVQKAYYTSLDRLHRQSQQPTTP